jgi:hypothetical protein
LLEKAPSKGQMAEAALVVARTSVTLVDRAVRRFMYVYIYIHTDTHTQRKRERDIVVF